METEVEGEEGEEVLGKRWRQRWRAKRGKKFWERVGERGGGGRREEVLGKRWRKMWRGKRGRSFGKELEKEVEGEEGKKF